MKFTVINTNTASLGITYNIHDNSISGDTRIFVTLADFGDEPNDDFNVSYYSSDFFVFDPSGLVFNPLTPNQAKPIDISIEDTMFTLSVGDYTLDFVLSNTYATDKYVTINLKVIDEEGYIPPSPNEYKLKYYIERPSYRLDIFSFVNPDTILVPKEINGTVDIQYQDKKDVFESIIASNLKLRLESGLDINLEELYTEEENQFKVILTSDNIIKFIGFIKPDGIFEDYIYDRWFLDIQCIDGLSTLKNISFSNENGIIYTGKRSVLSVIYDCLAKTSINLPINISLSVYYDTFDFFLNILESVIINTERYFQNADEPMDCDSVLRSLLTIFNASIIQMNGEWWIYRAIDLKTETVFDRYINGIYSESNEYLPDKIIGSQIDGYEIFHANKNQKKSISGSVQAYKISYQYGPANAVFKNPQLKLSGSGLDIEGWTVHTAPDGEVYRNSSGFGVNSKTEYFDINNVPPLLTLNQTIDIQVGATFTLTLNFSNDSIPPLSTYGLRFAIQIGNQWLQEDGSWTTGGASIYIANSDGTRVIPPDPLPPYSYWTGRGSANYTATIKAPVSGLLNIIVFRDTDPNHLQPTSGGYFSINSIFLSGTNNGDIKGIDYTGQRTRKTSTVTRSNITVNNGDSTSDLFVGTIYKDDADTPTSTWFRGDKPLERKELLSINAEDNLRVAPRPMLIFEGDVYGAMNYLSVISINNFEGKKFHFMRYSYSFDTKIIKMSLREVETAFLEPEDFRVDVRYNFGVPTKVTISGQ